MPKDIEKRVAELEKRVESIVRNQNKVNQKGHDVLKNEVQALNKVTQKAHDHITKLEKRLGKLEKGH